MSVVGESLASATGVDSGSVVQRFVSAASSISLAAQPPNSMKVRRAFERWVKATTGVDPDPGLATAEGALAEVQTELLAAQKAAYANVEMVAAIEALLVALLGAPDHFVREQATVLLNVLYDGHDLQISDPLPVTVTTLDAPPPTISLPIAPGASSADLSSLTLRVFGPPFDSSATAAPPKWSEHATVHRPPPSPGLASALTATLPQFPRPGFYDWSLTPASAALLPSNVLDPRRARGRFIVQPAGLRTASIFEVPVDSVDATWDESTGELQSRGSFETVVPLLPELKLRGFTGVYLFGALERPLSGPDVDASPFAIADREAPATALGGPKSFKHLTSEIARLGMVPIVDAFDRVSRSAHRKYRGLVVDALNDRGVPAPHPGTDGRENQWNESVLLNYRKVEVWDLMVREIKNLAKDYGVRGVRLENAQSYPLIMEADVKELTRKDPDGQYHYPLTEIFHGQIVRLNEEAGYWTTGAAMDLHYPNPFLIKLVRELWNEYQDFLIIAECNFQREPQLLASGVITHSIRIPQILCSVAGKSLRRDGSVAPLPASKRSTAKTLSRVLKADRDLLPNDAIMIQCSCNHSSPFPAALYGRKSWMAVDLVNLLPGIPMLLFGEDAGIAYRMNMAQVKHHEEESVYHVNYDKLIPKSPPRQKTSPLSSPIDGVSGLSLEPSNRGTPSPLSGAGGGGGLRRPASLADVRQASGVRRSGSSLSLKRVESNSHLVQVRTMEQTKSLAIRNQSVHDLKELRMMNDKVRDEIGPSVGFDISQIKGHYNHRSMIREEMEVFRSGKLWILSVEPQLKDRIFVFARYTDREIAIVAMNLKDVQDGEAYQHACDVDLNLQSLSEVLPESHVKRFQVVHQITDGFTGEKRGDELFTLEEFVFRKYTLHIEPLTTVVLMPVPCPDDKTTKEIHYTQALGRLEVEAADVKDPRENSVLSSIAHGAATSLTDFAKALEATRAGFVKLGLDEGAIQWQLQLCLQRASALRYNVENEGFQPPRDYEPPGGERIISYLSHLTTAAKDPNLLHASRKLVTRSQKIGPLVFLASELGRFSTAGGLGVMVDELTKDLAALGLDIYVISPYYTVNRKGQTKYIEQDGKFKWVRNIDVNIGSAVLQVGVFEGQEDGVNLIFLERGDFFPKVYADAGSQQKLLETIVLMSLGSLEAICQAGIQPAVVVTNDWLPALAAGYGKNGFFGDYFNNTTFFHLIHNLGDGAYEGRVYPSPQQGNFEFIHRLPVHLLVDSWWQQKVVNPSRCALLSSDSWGTVSPSYLKELRSSHPLKDVLNIARRPFAFPNGIRQAAREKLLLQKGGESHEAAKTTLQRKYFGFENGDMSIPLFAFVGRITAQKGVHLILNAVEELIHHTGGKIQILVGGPASQSDPYASGCASHMWHLRNKYRYSFWAAPDDFFTDGPTVNLGADFGLMPSTFEPGGIVQQEFFVAGTPVVAFKTGGLRDTVHEWNPETGEGNGFSFEAYQHSDFVWAIKRALRVFSRPQEYEELRATAYETTIDVSQVAWAWSSEFHRMRNAIYADASKIHSDLLLTAETTNEECLAPDAKLVSFRWTAGGKKVFLKGSFDDWTQQWPLGLEQGDAPDGPRLVRLKLPPGSYTYKFWVDGDWVLADDQPKRDDGGFTNNVVEVK